MNKRFNILYVIIGFIFFFFIGSLFDRSGPGWNTSMNMIFTIIGIFLVIFGILGFFTWKNKKVNVWISIIITIVFFLIYLLIDTATGFPFL